MKRLTLKEILVGYRMLDEIRIRIGNTLMFCGTIMHFRRKCIFSSFSKYLNCEVVETHESENGVYSLRIINNEMA